MQVRQDVDIYSLGCVLSEAVTWASQGWRKVLDYRHRRLEETYDRSGRREDCFHNDSGHLLETVGDVHRENISQRGPHDELTQPIIEGLIDGMLLSPGEPRPNARDLYRKSKQIIKPAHGVSHDATPRRSPRILPQSPPLKRPMYGQGRISSGSIYLEPKLPSPTRPGLHPFNFSSETSRDRSGSYQSISSVHSNLHRPDQPDFEHQTPSFPDTSTYNATAYSTLNGYQQARFPHNSPSVGNQDAYSRDRRPSTNDPGNLSSATEKLTFVDQVPEDSQPPPQLSVEDGLEMIEKKLSSTDDHLMEELQGRYHVCRAVSRFSRQLINDVGLLDR